VLLFNPLEKDKKERGRILTNFLHLFFTFFKVGLFTIGGGLAALPLLQNYSERYGWVDEKMFADMIAISESTPGPIGINMATYVGLSQYGFIGSIVATTGMVLPSLLIIYLIANFLKGFNEQPIVQGVLQGIRPVVIGIIGSALIAISKVTIIKMPTLYAKGQWLDFFEWKSLIIFGVFIIAVMKMKIHPIFFIVGAGVVGIILF